MCTKPWALASALHKWGVVPYSYNSNTRRREAEGSDVHPWLLSEFKTSPTTRDPVLFPHQRDLWGDAIYGLWARMGVYRWNQMGRPRRKDVESQVLRSKPENTIMSFKLSSWSMSNWAGAIAQLMQSACLSLISQNLCKKMKNENITARHISLISVSMIKLPDKSSLREFLLAPSCGKIQSILIFKKRLGG